METVYIEHADQIRFIGSSFLEKLTGLGLKLLMVCAVIQFAMYLLAATGYQDPVSIYLGYTRSAISILFYVVGIVFALWLRKAYRNLLPISDNALLYKPRWAILGFIVPIANLFVPYHMAQEIICYSSEERCEEGLSLVNRWWLLHILYFIAPPILLDYFSLDSATNLGDLTYLILLVWTVILFTGSLVCTSLLGFVTTAQEEAFTAQKIKNFYTRKPTCPVCGAELRTFRARQCPNCCAKWH